MTSACKNHARSTTCKMISGTDLHRRLDGSPSSTSMTLHSLPLRRHSPTDWAHQCKSRLYQKLNIYLGDTPSRRQCSSLWKATCCEGRGESVVVPSHQGKEGKFMMLHLIEAELRSALRAHVYASQLRIARILARACARMYLSCIHIQEYTPSTASR